MKRVLVFACVFVALAGTVALGQDAKDPKLIDRCVLQAIDDVSVPAPEMGILMSIEVKAGDNVVEDQPLAQIDDRQAVMARNVAKNEYFAAKKQAENQISVMAAEKSHDVAKAEWDAATEANAKVTGTHSATEVRRLKLTWERSGLQIDLAKFELLVARLTALAKLAQFDQADMMIERRKIKAPHGGVVDQILLNKGDWVQAGAPVVKVIRMDELRVHGRVDSKLYSWSDVIGRDVEVNVTLPGGEKKTIRSKISFASQNVDVGEHFRVHADIKNNQDANGFWLMGPGLEVEMRFIGL